MKIIMLGCGWLGQQLLPLLQQDGHQLIVTRQSAAAVQQLPGTVQGVVLSLPLSEPITAELQALFQQAVVICSLTPGWRKQAGAGYLAALESLAALMQTAGSLACIHFSSTGVYQGLSGEVDESTPLQLSDAKVQLLVQGEQIVRAAVPTCTLRLGGLFGPGRHPANFLRSGVIDEPDAAVNMVHSSDVLAAVQQIVRQQAWPALFNLCCPVRASRQQFYQQARASLALDALQIGVAQGHNQRRVLSDQIGRQLPFQFRYASALDALKLVDKPPLSASDTNLSE